MPIAPCFDPTTGASGGSQGGGGGGGGADLSALGFVEVDLTDGSWTLTDPDDLVDTVSHASGVNTVVMNALAAGSNNYAWSTSTTQRAPRWTRELNAVKTLRAVTFASRRGPFILQTVIEYVTPDDDFPAEIVVASAEDGTATTSGGNKAQGGLLIRLRERAAERWLLHFVPRPNGRRRQQLPPERRDRQPRRRAVPGRGLRQRTTAARSPSPARLATAA